MPDLDSLLESAKTKLVIVEGMKDKKALEELGFTNVVFLKNKPLYEFVESIEEKEVIILTDFDVKGKKLFMVLRRQLQRRGIKVDNKLRFSLRNAGLSHVEGIVSFLSKLQ